VGNACTAVVPVPPCRPINLNGMINRDIGMTCDVGGTEVTLDIGLDPPRMVWVVNRIRDRDLSNDPSEKGSSVEGWANPEPVRVSETGLAQRRW
jgi:hypothetical protein